MKIAHVTATFPPYQAGTGNVCFYNARELARLGHDVHVFTAALPDVPREETMTNVQVHRFQPWFQIGNAPLMPQLLTALRGFDIVHLHYPFIFGAELVRLATLAYRIPMVVTLHNDLIGNGMRAWLFTPYQKVSARFAVRAAARLCAVSEDHYYFSRFHNDLGAKRPLAVEMPNGVDTTLFHPNGSSSVREQYHIPADAKLVLFVAALDRAHHFKGLERLLKATAAISDVWLLIVGDGDMRLKYEQQAVDLGIAARTRFIGSKPQDQLPPFYRAADATALPSSPPESFGMVLIESLACGVPVIASNIPGVRSVVSPTKDGYLVPEGDISALTGQMKALLTLSKAERMSMGVRGRRKVEEQYAWNRIGQRLEKLYQDILPSSDHHRQAVSEMRGNAL